MELTVNGARENCADGMHLADFLTQRGHNLKAVVVERNGQIVPAGELAATELRPDDTLEIVHFVGGG